MRNHGVRRFCFAFVSICLTLLMTIPVHADSLEQRLDHILASPTLSGGISGAIVSRISDGKVLYEHGADLRLTPASNRKLFTSAVALEMLGSNYVFHTRVLTIEKPDPEGTLHGNLYLKGVGDSLLSPADLDAMADQVTKAGVKHITGNVIGDGTIFTDGPYGNGWSWDYLSDYYAMQIAGLEVSEGVLAVHVTPGTSVDTQAQVTVDQPTKYLPIVNTTRTVAKGAPNTCNISRPWDKNFLIVSGDLPIGDKADGLIAVMDPSHYAATVFAETLTRHGITIDDSPITGVTPSSAVVVLAEHSSVPMAQYIAKMNKPSNNLLAESLIRVVGVVKGKGGDYASGHAVEMPFFQSLGVDTSNLQLADGSGMARRNFVTPRAIAQLLRGMHGRSDWKTYYDSLPIAGVDGSLRNRMKSTKAAGNIHAKDGTLGEVSSLSGYVTGRDGSLYAFSLILNNFPDSADPEATEDQFAQTLAASL